MANRLAEDALAGREQASYRDYLNAMANTNIRSREQEAMDRYRQGELGIRGEDVSGLNQFRTGQIGIGRTDAATRAAEAANRAAYQQGLIDVARRDADIRRELGLGQQSLGGRQLDVNRELGLGQLSLGGRQLDVNRELGLGQQGVQRDLGLKDIGVRYELGKGQLDLGGRQLDVNRELGIGGLDVNREQLRTQLAMANLPYDRIPASQQRVFDLATQNPSMARSLLGIEPNQLDLLNAVEMNRQNEAYQNALAAEAADALREYDSTWFWDSDRSNKMMALEKEYGISKQQAARIVAEDRLAPLYGRESRFGNIAPKGSAAQAQAQPAPVVVGRGSNNPPVSITAPATNAALRTNLISAPYGGTNSGAATQASYDDMGNWLLGRSKK